MLPQRLSIKIFAADPGAVDLDVFTPIFHRWIQNRAVEGLLIDVADYKHVPDGPGILLIGHEADYSLDMAEGRPGLLYTRKRELPASLDEGLRQARRLALAACQLIEAETALRFDVQQAEVTLLDRLNTPNTEENFAALEPQVRAVFADLGKLNITRAYTDPRYPLSFLVAAG